MRIGGISTLETVHCKRETSVLEAALMMRLHHVGDLVVVDEDNGKLLPAGILTDRDIVMSVVAEGLDASSIEAGDIIKKLTRVETPSFRAVSDAGATRWEGIQTPFNSVYYRP